VQIFAGNEHVQKAKSKLERLIASIEAQIVELVILPRPLLRRWHGGPASPATILTNQLRRIFHLSRSRLTAFPNCPQHLLTPGFGVEFHLQTSSQHCLDLKKWHRSAFNLTQYAVCCRMQR
jgi:hypothetical protein